MEKKRYYFDYAATTPVSEAVFNAMKHYFKEKFGNAGSVHGFGQQAIGAIDRSREIIAKELNADFREVVFTGSATEANNLALRGAVLKWKKENEGKKPFDSAHGKPRIIISALEHDSVLETAKELAKEGAELKILKVNKDGVVDSKELQGLLNSNTVLVSIIFGNNEIGTIQPIGEIGKIISDFKINQNNEPGANIYPLFHSDASQAFQYLKCDVQKLGVDLLTISSHKIYGPKGAGALFAKRFGKNKGFCIQPISFGGSQEFGMRPGTENVPAVVGFGRAVEEAAKLREKESKRVAELKNYFWNGLKNQRKRLEINGDIKKTLPHILNVYFPKHKAEEVITELDLLGFAVSAGSACKARAVAPSYTVEALGYRRERALGSVRFSFGRETGKKEVKKLLEILKESI